MTKEELAARINGRQIGGELEPIDEAQAKASGLIVIYGASDDLVEFRGAITDEAGAYDGGEVYFTRTKLLPAHDDCDCEFCGFETMKATASKINAKWDEGGYSWLMETELPHATFEIGEDDEKYCRGLVIAVADLPA